ncbi:preprotein translocase subunit SecA [Flammeovirgaceae bacterium SG7u.111]|nr:preprotein translocase subunit SecA [Flammeovirgaceae bacterium SG7u.132]WPO38803.1 preprotein translocase subunit SecA [Flammeovirgaceae bacterium SG7u.111]
MMNFITKAISKIVGSKSDKDLKDLQPLVGTINDEHRKLTTVSDDALRAETDKIREEIDSYLKEIDGELDALHQQIADSPELDLDAKDAVFSQIDKLEEERNKKLEEVLMIVLPRAFAIMKETARRFAEHGKMTVTANQFDEELASKKDNVVIENGKATWLNEWDAAGQKVTWNMVHYDVQLIGGMVLHQGKIAEMATGEGKTLVATLPAFLNALARRGVHVITVNDYLAKRDSEWMAPLFEFHGLRTDCIDKHEPHSDGRKAAYASDIIYGTNNEFGFDYLRDNMSRNLDDQVQRKLHYAMVDEVDSVLIDDARTPLIISGPIPKGDEHEFFDLKPRVQKLIDYQQKEVKAFLNEAKKKLGDGNDEEGGLALLRAHRGLPKYKPLIKFLSEIGIKQKMQKSENFYLQENAKMMPEADKPLYFTIDEKNNSIDLTEKGLELITGEGEDKNFFVLPDIAIELSAIEKDESISEEERLKKKDALILDYTAKTQRIHTVNQLLKAYALFEKDTDYILVDGKVKIVDEQTGRVMEGRRYSDGLHQALEAKENVKIEDATQTYATVTLQNYFRMYHKLAGMTGTAETEAGEFWEIYKLDVVVIPTNRPIVRDDREDMVFKTVREKFNAVADEIQELVGKGRPVLVGTTSVEISEVLSRMLSMKKIDHQVLNAKQHAREADVVQNAGLPGTVTIATNMAGRGTDIKLHPDSKKAGGLAIVGTERHESRRVDRQLRGRSGRQGDPGSTQFFVSLEDNLMRLFGSDRIAKVMDRMGLQEGEVIQHSMITKSIERAQRKVEENNFAIRKRLLEYDDVMNSQREVIYKRRRNALQGERLQFDIMSNFYDVAQNIVENSIGDFEGFKINCLHSFGIDPKGITENDLEKGNPEDVAYKLYNEAYSHYLKKNEVIREQTLPVLSRIQEERGATVEEIVVPFSDGTKQIPIVVGLKDAVETKSQELVNKMEQNISLAIIDQNWKEHLREMDELKEQVQNARFEQKDPLLIYKFEAFELFKEFIGGINQESVSFLAKANVPQSEADDVKAAQRQKKQAPRLRESKADSGSVLSGGERQSAQGGAPRAPRQEVEVTKPIVSQKMPNRNDIVTVKYKDGTIKKDVKFKKVENDVRTEKCILM